MRRRVIAMHRSAISARAIPIRLPSARRRPTRMMSTAKHYESHSSASYEDAYFYSPGLYMEHLVDLVSKSMKLDSIDKSRHLIDLGGGTGKRVL